MIISEQYIKQLGKRLFLIFSSIAYNDYDPW